MDSDNNFTTSINAFNTVVDSENVVDSDDVADSDDIATSSSTIGLQDDSENNEFTILSKNFVFEAQKEAMVNHIATICQKILAEDKILYMQKINKKHSKNIVKSYPNEDIDMSSKSVKLF
ncbi:34895_t:CDS:2 [Racocetra persica]|uniref:34895_t:CDS:1 n=1 Tax=Racocetra persica TaxID=160502 RepID=A0ACA9MK56_9GLOM|nr:34895_t:CDS:2 [Racocetra persica]